MFAARSLSGSISWKKYISGIAMLSEEVRDDDAIKLAFKLFDTNDDGRIEKDELFAYAHAPHATVVCIHVNEFLILVRSFRILSNVITTITNEEVEQIFERVDSNHDGFIDCGTVVYHACVSGVVELEH
jgi:Ca2+-binding EF-hand superfamily protein